MKTTNILIIVAVYVSFVISSISFIDWMTFSDIVFGFHLYFGYLILCLIYSKPKSHMQYFQERPLHEGNQPVYDDNEIYEY